MIVRKHGPAIGVSERQHVRVWNHSKPAKSTSATVVTSPSRRSASTVDEWESSRRRRGAKS